MDYDDFVEEIEIESYNHLINEITKNKTFRKEYIFRGIGNVDYELVPKALRVNDGELKINEYIGSDFFVEWKSKNNQHDALNALFENFKISYDNYCEKISCKSNIQLIVDKNGEVINNFEKVLCEVESESELQIKRELYVLLKFFNWIDKIGLEVYVDPFVRRLIHYNINYSPKFWPNKGFFEIISLAQHHGLPTEALDWSYRYEVALYFAVNNVLHDDKNDAVLWAFNYKLFEDNYLIDADEPYMLQLYRPQYHINPNLKAQKGLFTFIINKNNNIDYRPLDKIIVDDLIKNSFLIDDEVKFRLNGLKEFTIPANQKIFYKFIIPSRLKPQILDELYRDGWSEKFLFPGYDGVVLSMKNSVKSYKKLNESFKHAVLITISDKSKEILFKIDFFKEICFNKNVDKIFINFKEFNEFYYYSDNNINLISEELKSKIFSLLHHDGWSEIFKFQGYYCVLISIENSMKLDKYLKDSPKKAVIMFFSKSEIKNIIINKKNIIFNELGLKNDVGKIFIFSIDSNEIYGYFENYKLIKNIRNNLWNSLNEDSISFKRDFFEYHNGLEIGFAIKLLNLKVFKFPIKLKDFKLLSYDRNFIYIEDYEEMNFLLNF